MPTHARDLHGSTTVKHQTRTWHALFTEDDRPYRLIATARWDDHCGNGHNTFAITGTIDRQSHDGRFANESAGCIHDDITQRLPELVPYLKWHLCGADRPLHYIPNTVYHAGDRDHWGLRAGEFLQDKDKTTGLPLWKLDLEFIDKHLPRTVSNETPPIPINLPWKPCGRTGEGKARDLDAARLCAIWPDATDDDLTAPGLEERLAARLPAIMAEFRAAVESLGFTW